MSSTSALSLIALQSAFVSELKLETVFDLFVVDLMHEFELGVWKAVLTHLIRILYTLGPGVITEFDRRYANQCPFGFFQGFNRHRFRQVPTYGLDTIRKFSNNVSEMKKLAARDFEDILQVRPLKIAH